MRWLGVIEHLQAVEEVRIHDCNEIRYLWESEANASKVFMNLRKLQVSFCSNMMKLEEKEEVMNMLRVVDMEAQMDLYRMNHCRVI
ncbi:hypothetical protein L1987_80031 [Smallanthus sonchifolius]|uniref:Uncharacterized protein n=1 Tax=Smallanthus sonchifolius TaxID=185202 RepID=A0ACB8YM76_9ASTR|nr:hypothetical protein L1987_80031 [Smallanthus sonchifolius]